MVMRFSVRMMSIEPTIFHSLGGYMDMENFTKKAFNPDYQKLYGIYKKLPSILAIVIMSLVFVWSIVDVSVFQYKPRYSSGYRYGVMELESAFLAMLIWWAIGAVVSVSVWFFSALSVSATVVRTDAIIELNNKTPENK